MGLQVTPQRQHELRSMSTLELFLLVLVDRTERELSVGEIRLIHDIAAERLEADDEEADELLTAVDAYMQ